jgi:hypothetical protein
MRQQGYGNKDTAIKIRQQGYGNKDTKTRIRKQGYENKDTETIYVLYLKAIIHNTTFLLCSLSSLATGFSATFKLITIKLLNFMFMQRTHGILVNRTINFGKMFFQLFFCFRFYKSVR